MSAAARGDLAGKRAFISTAPFGEVDRRPLDLLDASGMAYSINPRNHRLRGKELIEFIGDVDVLIAGTEPITAAAMEAAPRLRLISRVGIGLDSVDLLAARERGIEVSYTPDGPSPGVADLTVGLMISLLRGVPEADAAMRRGEWRRVMGRRLGEVTVGILGVGRIGKLLIGLLSGFGPRVLANDIAPDEEFRLAHGFEWAEKERIFREADIVSLHLPATHLTLGLVGREVLASMKPGAFLINT
ncbi:MAG: NAD(P)-dependent oxidoreductase, partial [bacterium]